jgi:predicted PurR-regulated permease PerM
LIPINKLYIMDSRKVQNIIFISLLGLVTLVFLYLLKPFFTPIFWAAVIAGIFKPLYERLLFKLNRPNLSAAMILFMISLIIILPASIIASLLITESMQLYDTISADTSAVEQRFRDTLSMVTNHPYVKHFNMNDQFIIDKFSEAVKTIANYIFVHLTSLTQDTVVFLIQFGVMIYTLYFFFRDGDKILKRAMRMCFLDSGRGKVLYEHFIATARATLKATVLLGGLQGISGGIIFYIAGIDGAIIWGLLMTVLAILPGIGCSIIWAPAGAIMLLSGHLWQGIAILTFGVLVISLGDNMLKPLLIGNDVEMHPLLIFLSTLGGLVVFGLSGFVIGPIIASLFLAIWDMYEQSSKNAFPDPGPFS